MTAWPAATPQHVAIWAIAGLATAAVITRPRGWPEAVWAVAGALALLLLGLVTPGLAAHAVGEGLDVYLFLGGMMLLAELARREGLFDTLAGWAVHHAAGSRWRLFGLVYGVGVLVTVFMSNDATAVVLTPAVLVVARQAGVRPLPYLFACAFVANAASFVLPISNPANLVVFGSAMPPLREWARLFALPSLGAIAGTAAAMAWLFRAELRGSLKPPGAVPPLSRTGRIAAGAVVVVAAVLLAASAAGIALGAPTLAAAGAAVAVVQGLRRENPWALLRGASWSVLALVAGLFVLVAAVGQTGVTPALAAALHAAAETSARDAAWGAGVLVAIASNLMNNLPAGLLAGAAVADADVPHGVRAAIAIGIDLGPNLSVTGSLATLLWLVALRREGENVSAWAFLRVGAWVMPAGLLLALLAMA